MKGRFISATRNVIPEVGTFCEHLCLSVMSSDREQALLASSLPNPNLFYAADVIVPHLNIALQVKGCNGRHAVRIPEGQILSLQQLVKRRQHFLFKLFTGFNFFVLYRGVQMRNGKARSLLLPKKLTTEDRNAVIAEEIRCIYLIDNQLLYHMVQSDDSRLVKMRRNDCSVIAAHKVERRHINGHRRLYLNRTFLKGFAESQLRHNFLQRSVMRNALRGKAITKELQFDITFFGTRLRFSRSLPIKIICSGSKIALFEKQLCGRKHCMSLHPQELEDMAA